MARRQVWSTAAALATVRAQATTWAEAPYDYEDIVDQYCHPSLDWGAIPGRPAGAMELLQAQVFIRHGARVQIGNDFCWEGAESTGSWTCGLNYLENSVEAEGRKLTPDFRLQYMAGRNMLSGNCMSGQLVESGFEMERRNGERLREAYAVAEPLIPPSLAGLTDRDVDRAFRFTSTDVPRTKQSAMALISALYGQEALGSMPYLRLRTMDYSEENMVANTKTCPSIAWRTAAYLKGLPSELKVELEDLCAHLSPGAAMSVSGCFIYLDHLVDCLMSRLCPTVPFEPRGSVPATFLDRNASILRRVFKAVDVVNWGSFKDLTEGGAWASLVSEILDHAQRAASGIDDGPKFALFSGHDTGPMYVLYAALGLQSEPPYWPPFAAMLVMELWNSSSGPLVRWVSNGKVVVPPTPFSEYRHRLEAIVETAAACHAQPSLLDIASQQRVVAAVSVAGSWSSSRSGFVTFALGCLTTLALLQLLQLPGLPRRRLLAREAIAVAPSPLEGFSQHVA